MKNDLITSALLSYFIGSLPLSVLASKYILKKDIREVGSGNIGTSNAYRAGGFLFSLLVAVIDVSKGLIVAKFIMPGQTLGVFAVCVGQMFPFALKFKGGKGVACYIGSLIGIYPIVGSIVGLTWLLITKLIKMPFLSSILVLMFSIFFFPLDKYMLALYLIIIYKHKNNFIEFMKKYNSIQALHNDIEQKLMKNLKIDNKKNKK